MDTRTMVMTKKEREAGELERHEEMRGLLVELRILNRISKGGKLMCETIYKKGERLTQLWNGKNEYKKLLSGE